MGHVLVATALRLSEQIGSISFTEATAQYV
jgi:hypothetical protein